MEFYRGEQPPLPALEMLLSRGRSKPFKTGGDSGIFAETAQENISYAQQRLAGEDEQPKSHDSGFWYCADPVYLKADRDQVILTHPASIQIQNSEADALIDAFNQLFKEDGIQLWRASMGEGDVERWYLRSEQPWQLVNTPLDQIEGKGIRDWMSQGVDALRWNKVIAEVEMLFFGHPVNQRRSERGEPMISSIWLWGELNRQPPLHLEWDLIVGVHPLLKGVSRLQRIPLLKPDTLIDALISYSGNGLMMIDDLPNLQRYGLYQEAILSLQKLEQQLFQPLLSALWQGKLNELTIQPANGAIYTISRANLMRFWRRVKRPWLNSGA